MKLTRIAAVIAIAMTMPSAFAAGMEDNAGKDQTSGATTARKWYESGDRALQSVQGEAVGLPGFPKPGEFGAAE